MGQDGGRDGDLGLGDQLPQVRRQVRDGVLGIAPGLGLVLVQPEAQPSRDRQPALADLDLRQARRHAAVLTGCMLGGELAGLQMAARVTLRGLAAVQAEWSSRRTSAREKAGMFDCPADLPGHPCLDDACQQAHRTGRSGNQAAILDGAVTAAMAVERPLTMALICARYLGRQPLGKHDGCRQPRPPLAVALLLLLRAR